MLRLWGVIRPFKLKDTHVAESRKSCYMQFSCSCSICSGCIRKDTFGLIDKCISLLLYSGFYAEHAITQYGLMLK